MSHVDDGTLHAYVDGELSPAEARGVDAHLTQCPGCRERLEQERALIARASELLALAQPPDRDVPPFRAGDLPSPRLWWHVRLPLAWAATVALALGVGWYLGGEGLFAPARRPPATSPVDETAREPLAPAVAARPSRPLRPAPRVAREPGAPEVEPPAGRAVSRAAVPAPTPAPSAPEQRALRESPISITLDSARALLDHDPLALPDVPIRSVRHTQMVGAVAVVVIEQQLDSSTVIELREFRPTALQLGAVVVTEADAARARPDSAPGAPRPYASRAERRPAEPQLVHERGRPVLRTGDLEVEISGPLPVDSLRSLLKRVRPVRP